MLSMKSAAIGPPTNMREIINVIMDQWTFQGHQNLADKLHSLNLYHHKGQIRGMEREGKYRATFVLEKQPFGQFSVIFSEDFSPQKEEKKVSFSSIQQAGINSIQ